MIAESFATYEHATLVAAARALAARVRELEAAGVSGHCVEIGDDDSGQPMLLIHTTREEIKNYGRNLALAKVKVSLA